MFALRIWLRSAEFAEVTLWQLLASCLRILLRFLIVNDGLADFKLAFVDDEDHVTLFTFMCNDLSSLANLLMHAEMDTLERVLR